MGDLFRFPVFLRCRDLSSDQVKAVQTYLRVRRRSGGGDSGDLTRVKEGVYRIAYKHQKDQQAVLQRSQHVVELQTGPVVFTVRDKLEEFPSAAVAVATPDQDLTAPVPSTVFSEVKARLMSLEEAHAKRGSLLSEKQTSTRRLGEAKLRLLWKEMESSLGQECPGVKVTQGEAGQVVLEGSVEEILKAGVRVSDLESSVVERRVSDKSPQFLAFLRKTYGGPGVLADFLGVGGKVEVELRDTELRLFTMTPDKLDEVEKKLQDSFKEVKISLPNNPSVPPDLQETLMSKIKGMNQAPPRAQALFGPQSTVSLMGHTKEVEELSEIVTQFISDFSIVQIKVHLPFPDLAQKLPELLQLYEFDCSGVTLHPPTTSPEPTVVLEGPASKVTEVSVRLDAFLVPFIQDIVSSGFLETERPTVADDLAHSLASLSLHGENTVGSTAAAAAPGDGVGVHVEIIQGTIETQQVDALVSPMIDLNPLSTRVGNALVETAGPQLSPDFSKDVSQAMMMNGVTPGDPFLVEDLPGLPSNAVFFLDLLPWDYDHHGTAVEVLRAGVNSVLTSCERRGFRSVALPVLGAGIVLCFPVTLVARVLLEEVGKFEQDRRSRTPLRVHIVIHPNDQEAMEAFTSVQKAFQVKRPTKDVHKPDEDLPSRRIVLLGKTGSGKSSLANNIFGENLFEVNHTPNSGTSECQAETRTVNRRSVTLIDTPGFFDSQRSEEDLKREVIRCITECAPGPHAFLILLKVEKFTEQEQAVVDKICQSFTEDALKYAVVVFTHGNQLPDGVKIEEFVGHNKKLSDLVKKCGGRCHVIDNTYWKNNMADYRSNQVQVEDLLCTVDKMVRDNNGGYYVNEVFAAVEKKIQEVVEEMKKSGGNMTVNQIRKKAKAEVFNRLLIVMTGTATGALLGAVFGVAFLVKVVIRALQNPQLIKNLLSNPAGKGLTAMAAADVGLVAAGVGGAAALAGGVAGGVIGNQACEGAETLQEAAEMAFKAVKDKGNAALEQIDSFKM